MMTIDPRNEAFEQTGRSDLSPRQLWEYGEPWDYDPEADLEDTPNVAIEAERAGEELAASWLQGRYWELVHHYANSVDGAFWAEYRAATAAYFGLADGQVDPERIKAVRGVAKAHDKAAHDWASQQYGKFSTAARRMALELEQEAIMATRKIQNGDKVLVRDFNLVGEVVTVKEGDRQRAGYYVIKMPGNWIVTRGAEMLRRVG